MRGIRQGWRVNGKPLLVFCILTITATLSAPVSVEARPLQTGLAMPAQGFLHAPVAIAQALSAGQPQNVIVILKDDYIRADAENQQTSRHLDHWDPEVFSRVKSNLALLKKGFWANYNDADVHLIHDHPAFPAMFVHVQSLRGLQQLDADPQVAGIYENSPRYVPQTYQNFQNLINQPAVTAAGYMGTGQTIAVFDVGFPDADEFPGKIAVLEHCLNHSYGDPSCYNCSYEAVQMDPNDDPDGDGDETTDVEAVCAEGGLFGSDVTYLTAEDSGQTHASDVIETILDVAPGARIAMLNLGSNTGDNTPTDSEAVFGAFDWVAQNYINMNVHVINFSMGSIPTYSPSACTGGNDPMSQPIAYMKSLGVAFVAASGNGGDLFGMSEPACDSRAVSVGSVYSDYTTAGLQNAFTLQDGDPCTDSSYQPDQVPCYSNYSSSLTILAPGCHTFTYYGSQNGTLCGTSLSAPVVSASIAVLTAMGGTYVVNRMVLSGKPIVQGVINKPRLDLNAAVQAVLAANAKNPPPVVSPPPSSGTGTPVSQDVQNTIISAVIAVLL